MLSFFGAGNVPLVVSVASLSGSIAFEYEGPSITGVSASPVDAAVSSVIEVHGKNLGLADSKYTTASRVIVGMIIASCATHVWSSCERRVC